MIDRKIERLKECIGTILAHAETITNVSKVLGEMTFPERAQRGEAYITEKLAFVLPSLAVVLEASGADFDEALKASDLSDEQAALTEDIRKTYAPFKSEVQASHLAGEGYLNRVTTVRHRGVIFTYSGLPAIDITLRSFDKNILRIIDTLDNIAACIAGMTEGIAAAYARAMEMGLKVPAPTAKRLEQHLGRMSKAIAGVSMTTSPGESVGRGGVARENLAGKRKRRSS